MLRNVRWLRIMTLGLASVVSVLVFHALRPGGIRNGDAKAFWRAAAGFEVSSGTFDQGQRWFRVLPPNGGIVFYYEHSTDSVTIYALTAESAASVASFLRTQIASREASDLVRRAYSHANDASSDAAWTSSFAGRIWQEEHRATGSLSHDVGWDDDVALTKLSSLLYQSSQLRARLFLECALFFWMLLLLFAPGLTRQTVPFRLGLALRFAGALLFFAPYWLGYYRRALFGHWMYYVDANTPYPVLLHFLRFLVVFWTQYDRSLLGAIPAPLATFCHVGATAPPDFGISFLGGVVFSIFVSATISGAMRVVWSLDPRRRRGAYKNEE